MYKTSRKSANLSIEESAFRLHIAPRTLCKYESRETVPSPEVVLAMSREYRRPEMTLNYCRQNCAIGRAYSYDVLDAVDTSLVTVLAKLGGEIDEARGMLGRAMSLAINRMERDNFTDGEWGEFSGAVLEFLDVEHNIEVLKLALGRMTDVSELVEQHNKKCRDSGYTKQKPLKAVRA